MQTEFIRHFLTHAAPKTMHMIFEIDSFKFFHTFTAHKTGTIKWMDNGFLANCCNKLFYLNVLSAKPRK